MVAVSPRRGKEKKKHNVIRTTFGAIGCMLLLLVFWIAHVVFIADQNPTGAFDVLSSNVANNQQQQQQQQQQPQPQQNVVPSSSSSYNKNGILKKYSSTICSQLLNDAEREVQENHAAKVQKQQAQKKASAAAKKNKKNENQNKEIAENDNDDDLLMSYVLDPNYGEIHARLTTTNPSFWISTHNASFDPVRAGIMKKGRYYEFKMTEHVQSMLKNNNTTTAVVEEIAENGEQNNKKKKDRKKKGIVVDVGMNIGWYSMLAASMGRDVVAFEPNTFHHVRACQSLRLNGWDDGSSSVNKGGDNNNNNDNDNHDDSHEERKRPPRVRMYEYGVGDKAGEFYLNFERKSSGSAKISPLSTPPNNNNNNNNVVKRISNTPTVQTITNENGDFVTIKNFGGQHEPIISYSRKVKVLTLDEFAREEGWFEDKVRISLLKVDVEGAEAQVYMGATELIKSGLVENILGEFTLVITRVVPGAPDEVFNKFVDVVSLFHNAGYCLHLIGNWAGDGTHFEKYKKQKEFPWESKHTDFSRDLARYLFDYGAATKQRQLNMWWIKCKE